MGERAMKFKVKHTSWWRRNLWESNAFGYFDHTTIESTVRRVVNLRLKGPSIFWCRASAEAILLLRSYYKAGRWNLLKHMATSHRALLEA